MEKQSTRKFLKLMIALVALFLLGSSALMLASCKEELHKHTWDEGKVTNEATCISTGSRTYTCSECGDIRIETIPATGVHTWGDPVEYAASCESDAYTIETCTVCGQEKTTILPNTKRDHNYAEHLVAASCTAAGSRTLSCTYCNDTYIDSHYAQEHPALGHSFAANEKEDDTLYGVAAKNVSAQGAATVTVEITLNEETYTGTGADEATALAAAVEAAKKDGWTTKTAPNCTTAGEFVRTCSRCQITETAEAKATGHKVAGQTMNQTLAEALKAQKPSAYVCTVNTSLVDAENKAIYAFECVNENCPVNVKVNAAGTTKHYIEAEAHKYGEAVPSENKDGQHPAATCEGEGYTQATCEVCGTIEYTKVEKLGHNWNTMQLNGTTATGKCEKDTVLSGTDGLKKMAAFVRDYLDDDEKYLDEYKKVEAAYNDFFTTQNKKDASRFCLRCYAIDEATDHEYVIGTLQDGKYAPTDYIVDENGDPVVAEGVTKDTMTCRNVEVCKNCGKTGTQGAHDFDPDDASCRSGAICSVCNNPQTAQKEHEYVNVGTIITNKDQTTTIADIWETITWKDAYAAYQKVSASLEWMAPVPGTCTTAGYNVAVCVHCLMDASEGVEFDWKRDELDEGTDINDLENGKTYSAYTQAVSASHEYEAAYFYTDVATPVKAEALSMYQLNCQVGYKTAYFCKNCDLLYTNVPEVHKDGENDPAADNAPGTLGYTDKAGFVIAKDAYTGSETAVEWTQTKVDEVLAAVEDNVGLHKLYIPNDYRDVKYTPATCASYAKIYYRCANCSFGIELEAKKTQTATATYEFATGEVTDKLTQVKHANALNSDGADLKYDPKNHAGTEFACGDHCKVTSADGKKYICSGFVSQEPGTTLGSETVESQTDAKHESVTITYLWSIHDSVEYYKSYDIRFATVTDQDIKEGVIDWTNVEISEKPETYIKACASTSTPFIPVGEKASGNDDGIYLVLVKGDDVYPVKDGALKFYTEDTASAATEVKPENKPQQDDQFFVRFADGKEGTAITDAPVVAVNTDSFELALKGAAVPGTDNKTTLTITVGKSFTVDKSFMVVDGTFTWDITEADNYVLDLGGYTVTSEVGQLLTIGDNLTVKNGKFVFNAENSGLAIDAAGCTVTFDNVDLVFEQGDGLNIEVAEKMANVVFNNSSVTVNEGTKGIYTTGNVPNTSNAVTLKDTDVTVVPSTGTKDTAAMVIEVPVTVNVTGGTFTGTYQAIVVRAGTVTVDGATLDVKNDKSVADTDPTNEENFKSSVANDTYGDTKWNQFAMGPTLQEYRQHGIWTNGAEINGLPRAAVVVGSSGTTGAVKFSSTVKLTNITYANATYAKVVVGAYFGENVTNCKVVVNAVDGNFVENKDTDGYILCDNYTDGIVTINGTDQKHPAN